ncbi:KAP family P-loop NTPase fold protein [Burkholderia gladioli]|uniref:KAP family P-loop NTPase fold protein n=1 Tax=Burkholderia gladioli TaxID=28095 RepID=UPI0016420D26|nr:P-loop NTPase fold protein [Burkholderia gladioli]MDN7917342.1 P-loop NTPase fold protein [Burkholderia gladioli]
MSVQNGDYNLEPAVDLPLGSDSPQTDPAFDAFGYAPFAKAIARAAAATPNPKGLVMAIDGPWGAGKSSLLNFVRHYLTPPNCVSTSPPVLVDFNPWWFADRDQLAMQFLTQFRARFPSGNAVLSAAANTLAEYADAIGTAVSGSVSAAAGGPIPLLDKAVAATLKLFKHAPKDVQKLKSEIMHALGDGDQRFVIFVDDIDRLTPEEIREVFKVIKAVADFPNVVYILAFDRKLVSNALEAVLEISDGDAYLQKIVQAQFSLPVVSHSLITDKFTEDLSRLFNDLDNNSTPIDPTYWGNVFYGGLASFIKTPRDALRIINSILVIYPGLQGEVNIVDFVAIECIRILTPMLYTTIRDNKKNFVDLTPDTGPDGRERAFHENWLNSVAPEQQETIKKLIGRIFPRTQAIWSNSYFAGGFLRTWDREARVCRATKFDRYFQFSVSTDVLSEREIREFIDLDDDIDALKNAWLAACDARRRNGSCKANDFISALMSRDDLPESFAEACLKAFFIMGDHFVGDPRNVKRDFFPIDPSIQAYWIVNHLTNILPEDRRELLILQQIRDGEALLTACHITHSIERMHAPNSEERDSPFQKFGNAIVEQLPRIAASRIQIAAHRGELGLLPDIRYLLGRWHAWGDEEEVKQWFAAAIADDAVLLRLLENAVTVGSTHTVGDHVSRRFIKLDPRIFEPYLLAPLDLEALSARVDAVAASRHASESQIEAIRAFGAGMRALREGKNPNARDPE